MSSTTRISPVSGARAGLADQAKAPVSVVGAEVTYGQVEHAEIGGPGLVLWAMIALMTRRLAQPAHLPDPSWLTLVRHFDRRGCAPSREALVRDGRTRQF
jgi:hypothetical protein